MLASVPGLSVEALAEALPSAPGLVARGPASCMDHVRSALTSQRRLRQFQLFNTNG